MAALREIQESVLLVEPLGLVVDRIDNNHIDRRAGSNDENLVEGLLQESFADMLPLKGCRYGEPGNAHRRDRILWQALLVLLGKFFERNLGSGEREIPRNSSVFGDGNEGFRDPLPVVAGSEAPKEEVEFVVSAAGLTVGDGFNPRARAGRDAASQLVFRPGNSFAQALYLGKDRISGSSPDERLGRPVVLLDEGLDLPNQLPH